MRVSVYQVQLFDGMSAEQGAEIGDLNANIYELYESF